MVGLAILVILVVLAFGPLGPVGPLALGWLLFTILRCWLLTFTLGWSVTLGWLVLGGGLITLLGFLDDVWLWSLTLLLGFFGLLWLSSLLALLAFLAFFSDFLGITGVDGILDSLDILVGGTVIFGGLLELSHFLVGWLITVLGVSGESFSLLFDFGIGFFLGFLGLLWLGSLLSSLLLTIEFSLGFINGLLDVTIGAFDSLLDLFLDFLLWGTSSLGDVGDDLFDLGSHVSFSEHDGGGAGSDECKCDVVSHSVELLF